MQVTACACGWMFESMYTATSNGSRRPACWRRAAGQAPAGGNWTSTSPRGSSSSCCDGSQFSCKLPTIDAIIACRFRLERKCRQNKEAMKNPRCLGPSRSWCRSRWCCHSCSRWRQVQRPGAALPQLPPLSLAQMLPPLGPALVHGHVPHAPQPDPFSGDGYVYVHGLGPAPVAPLAYHVAHSAAGISDLPTAPAGKQAWAAAVAAEAATAPAVQPATPAAGSGSGQGTGARPCSARSTA